MNSLKNQGFLLGLMLAINSVFFLQPVHCSSIIRNMIPSFVQGDVTGIWNGIENADNTNTVNNENGPIENKYSFLVTIVIELFALIVLIFLYFFAVFRYKCTW